MLVKKKIEYTKEELEFAKVILSEFCKKAKDEEPVDGLIRVKFNSRYWGAVDEGYDVIDELLCLKKFNSLFRHYNIYVGNVSYFYNSDSYFELVWDYRTYMNSLNKPKMQEKIRTYEKNKSLIDSKKSQEASEIEKEIGVLQLRLDKLREKNDRINRTKS